MMVIMVRMMMITMAIVMTMMMIRSFNVTTRDNDLGILLLRVGLHQPRARVAVDLAVNFDIWEVPPLHTVRDELARLLLLLNIRLALFQGPLPRGYASSELKDNTQTIRLNIVRDLTQEPSE